MPCVESQSTAPTAPPPRLAWRPGARLQHAPWMPPRSCACGTLARFRAVPCPPAATSCAAAAACPASAAHSASSKARSRWQPGSRWDRRGPRSPGSRLRTAPPPAWPEPSRGAAPPSSEPAACCAPGGAGRRRPRPQPLPRPAPTPRPQKGPPARLGTAPGAGLRRPRRGRLWGRRRAGGSGLLAT